MGKQFSGLAFGKINIKSLNNPFDIWGVANWLTSSQALY